MDKETLSRIKLAAPRQGLFLGLMWIFSFVGIANAYTSPLFSVFGLGLGIGSLFSAVIIAYQFRWLACKGNLPVGGQWLQVLLMLFYACILMAMGLYVYMQFFDQGNFGRMYESLLEMPEQKQVLEAMLEGTNISAEEFVGTLTTVKPINFAIELTKSNLIASFMISPFITLLARIPRVRFGNKQLKL